MQYMHIYATIYAIYAYIDPKTTPIDRHIWHMECLGYGQSTALKVCRCTGSPLQALNAVGFAEDLPQASGQVEPGQAMDDILTTS